MELLPLRPQDVDAVRGRAGGRGAVFFKERSGEPGVDRLHERHLVSAFFSNLGAPRQQSNRFSIYNGMTFLRKERPLWRKTRFCGCYAARESETAIARATQLRPCRLAMYRASSATRMS
jgi:hypothetical protein